MERRIHADDLACFPVALHPIPVQQDPDDSEQVLSWLPNRTGRELPRSISAEIKLAPFDRPLRKLPELRNRLLMASAPLRGQIIG
jgi:hypothetical protein